MEGSTFSQLEQLLSNTKGQVGLSLLKRDKRERDEDMADVIGIAMEERNKRFMLEREIDLLRDEKSRFFASVCLLSLEEEEEEEEKNSI